MNTPLFCYHFYWSGNRGKTKIECLSGHSLADSDRSSLSPFILQKHFSLWCHRLIYAALKSTVNWRWSSADDSRWSFIQFLSSPSGIWVTEFRHTSWPQSGLKAKRWVHVGGAQGKGALKSEEWFKCAEREEVREKVLGWWNYLKKLINWCSCCRVHLY